MQHWLVLAFYYNIHNTAGYKIVNGLGGSMVNLTVECKRDRAELSFSADGLYVDSLRAAQHCSVVDGNGTIISEVKTVK